MNDIRPMQYHWDYTALISCVRFSEMLVEPYQPPE